MQNVIIERPNLDEHDFATLRSMYSECQSWTRHYESLVITINTFLVSSSMIILGFAFYKEINLNVSILVPIIPTILSVIGIGLTLTLFKLYAQSIERLIKIENLLNCYDESKLTTFSNYKSILPLELMTLPVKWPTTVKFFVLLHGILLLLYGVIFALSDWLV